MEYPQWADQGLSDDLSILRSRGESQELEYMQSFPQNVHELGKEIAAFSTSNQGLILIGVSDEGDLVGLSEASSSEGRDKLLRRVEGICNNAIKPAVTPVAKFAVEDEKIVFALLVPKGSQPFYATHNIPYIRHITESRPAEPHELIDLVRHWLRAEDVAEEEKSSLINEIASIINDIIIYGEESSERHVNPWLDLWLSQYKSYSSQLKDFAVKDEAIQKELNIVLSELSNKLDSVANFQMYLGCGEEFTKLVTDVLKIAYRIKKEKIDVLPLSEDAKKDCRNIIIENYRKLDSLVNNAESIIDNGEVSDLQSEISKIGYKLLKISLYNIKEILPAESVEELYHIGKDLHITETIRIYMDGGASIQKLVSHLTENSNKLEEVIKSIQ